ncbi:Six-hairpin glycosidase-like protein [Cladorrhinum sp. PSN332]|nr:Six-hairpin glycosidase-like protein [Cladorrhinum sp. PSN332]
MYFLGLLTLLFSLAEAISVERRRQIVQEFSVRRNASSETTPLQVGNGNFAFGADITGLQTFKPYAILSTWGWHNFSLPTAPGQTSPEDFTGLDWWTHGRLVNYEQPNPSQPEISNWLRENPHRINLGRVGFDFGSPVTEDDLQNKTQELDMWAGVLTSSFRHNDTAVQVSTAVDPDSDSIAITVNSALLSAGLGVFFDFPYPTKDKFNAPFVGVYNETWKHKTVLEQFSPRSAQITHILDNTTYYASIAWSGLDAIISHPDHGSHRYILTPSSQPQSHNLNLNLNLTVTFSSTPTPPSPPSTSSILTSSQTFWSKLFSRCAFIDLLSLPANKSPQARTLQNRIITSLYLTSLNSASSLPPQESGLVNNGWHGKFHLEMTLWHLLPFARFGLWDLFSRAVPSTYDSFLESSVERARKQGYKKGARWGKMTDPEGRSAPGEINSLLVWQQPGLLYLAEMEYRRLGRGGAGGEEKEKEKKKVLKKWDRVIRETADFMADFAYFNTSTHKYDLGPPMYSVSENTNPNLTRNAVFELAFWEFGLDVAVRWKERQGEKVPAEWMTVRDGLAPLPVENGTYVSYEGIPGMWIAPETTFDHPGMAGVYGLLPPGNNGNVDLRVMRNTADKIRETWRLEESYGWDFAMLAMNELRLGRPDRAVEYLLHPVFEFDDAGYPVGGSRVPTPYFPNAAGLLVAVGMMAGGWDGDEGVNRWPSGWEGVIVDGFERAL